MATADAVASTLDSGQKKARQGGLVGPVLPPSRHSQRGEGEEEHRGDERILSVPVLRVCVLSVSLCDGV